MTERALVYSSSGVRLVFEIGATRRLVEETEASWTHVYGSSGGALLAAFMCMYPVGQEKKAIEEMEALVAKSNGDNGMRSYFPCGIFQGLLWHKALFDASFLRSLVKVKAASCKATARP